MSRRGESKEGSRNGVEVELKALPRRAVTEESKGDFAPRSEGAGGSIQGDSSFVLGWESHPADYVKFLEDSQQIQQMEQRRGEINDRINSLSVEVEAEQKGRQVLVAEEQGLLAKLRRLQNVRYRLQLLWFQPPKAAVYTDIRRRLLGVVSYEYLPFHDDSFGHSLYPDREFCIGLLPPHRSEIKDGELKRRYKGDIWRHKALFKFTIESYKVSSDVDMREDLESKALLFSFECLFSGPPAGACQKRKSYSTVNIVQLIFQLGRLNPDQADQVRISLDAWLGQPLNMSLGQNLLQLLADLQCPPAPGRFQGFWQSLMPVPDTSPLLKILENDVRSLMEELIFDWKDHAGCRYQLMILRKLVCDGRATIAEEKAGAACATPDTGESTEAADAAVRAASVTAALEMFTTLPRRPARSVVECLYGEGDPAPGEPCVVVPHSLRVSSVSEGKAGP